MKFVIFLATSLTGVIILHSPPAQAARSIYAYGDYNLRQSVIDIGSRKVPGLDEAEKWLLELGNENLTAYFSALDPYGNSTDPVFSDPKRLSSIFANRQLFVQRAMQIIKQSFEKSFYSIYSSRASAYSPYYLGIPDIFTTGANLIEQKFKELLTPFSHPYNVARSTIYIRNSSFAILRNKNEYPGFPHVFCLYGIVCNTSERYRSFDGSCNNLYSGLLRGRSYRSLWRYLPAEYFDGINTPRRSKLNNEPLKSARKISMEISKGIPDPDPVRTTLLMIFGQFLDHDLELAPPADLLKNISGTLQSVSPGCDTDCSTDNPYCLPIKIQDNDPDFPNTTCFPFTRTKSSLPETCLAGPREQLNEVTSYLDLSQIYGSTKEENMKLRNTTHPHLGLLRTEAHPMGFKDLLPRGNYTGCKNSSDGTFCFRSGDLRVNDNAALSALHTVYHRYHNFLATELRRINPHWYGEKLFQEARKFLIAIWQYQVYHEYLPAILGPNVTKDYGIEMRESGSAYHYYRHYDIPDISNAFATAAFRMLHSAIPDKVKTINSSNGTEREFAFSETIHKPSLLFTQYPSKASPVDAILRGMFKEPMGKVSRRFTSQVKKHWFTDYPPHGMEVDLVALDIQRGRDHGLPGYNAWRNGCGLHVAKTFDDLIDIWRPQQKRFKKLYKSVDDIDLFVGGISERPVHGGIVGPTFACIIAQQFRRLRRGDRFWFEGNTFHRNQARLDEIKKSLISRMLCDVGDDITHIQRYVLLQPITKALKGLGINSVGKNIFTISNLYRGDKNEEVNCTSLPRVNLELWKETP